ncbi:hypothetical protein AAC691_19690 [Nguyenibacter vanlangensis]|uniref:Uncharacterized protein n=1 Tax=Nguyenibacter vanlangensis TaxID=1216886 RepID=A0ABZ3D470_9PROT
MRLQTAEDFCAFPLKFEAPPDYGRGLSRQQLGNMCCYTTTQALQKWTNMRKIGAVLKSQRASLWLRDVAADAGSLARRYPDCYLALFHDGDAEQPGRMMLMLWKADEQPFVPHAFCYAFKGDAADAPDELGWPYLIYAEYLRQQDLERAEECCPPTIN